jgi:hypothetical protein
MKGAKYDLYGYVCVFLDYGEIRISVGEFGVVLYVPDSKVRELADAVLTPEKRPLDLTSKT